MKASKGFSLTELVVVIGIIGIVATVGAFSYQRYVANANLRTAAREMVVDFNAMKAGAVSKPGTTYSIDFDKTANTYTMNGTTVQTKSLAPSGQGHGSTYIFSLPGGVATWTLTFLARGTLSVSQGTIELRNNLGSKAEIKFNVTGKTYVVFTML